MTVDKKTNELIGPVATVPIAREIYGYVKHMLPVNFISKKAWPDELPLHEKLIETKLQLLLIVISNACVKPSDNMHQDTRISIHE